MNLSNAGAAFIRELEGNSTKFYMDASTPPVGTIGIGFTWASGAFREWWDANKPGMKFGPGATIMREESDEALAYIVDREYGAAVNGFLGDVPQHVFDGAVSPVYNIGRKALGWKWAAAVKRGDYKQAAELLRATGTTAGGKVLRGLVLRRAEEGQLIELGDYTVGKLPDDPMADGVLRRGERGEAVKTLQSSLAGLGLYDGKIDGLFGYGTEAAVLSFQRAIRLKADGYAGEKTLAALASAKPNTGHIGPDVSEPNPIPLPSSQSQGHKPPG